MKPTWREAMLAALHRYTTRHRTAKIDRKSFLELELPIIIRTVESTGKTPAQTASRILQELRDEGHLFFSIAGVYVFLGQTIDLTREDLDSDIVEHAISRDALVVPDVPVTDAVGTARLRVGTEALRRLTLSNYNGQCALCDTTDRQLLVTSHVARWADRPEARGKLSNTICFCTLHDRLFEVGYFGLQDDLTVLRHPRSASTAIRIWLDRCTGLFRSPTSHRPDGEYLGQHRLRVGLRSG